MEVKKTGDKVTELTLIIKEYEEFTFTLDEKLNITKICGIDKEKWNGEIIEGYVLSYNANEGQEEPDIQIQYDDNAIIISSKKPKREGYLFKSWNTKQDGTGTNYNSGETIKLTQNTTLYAIWEVVENYSILTSNGVVKANSFAGDSLGVNAYDGSLETYVPMTRNYYKYIRVNSDVIGKKVKVTYSMDRLNSNIAIGFSKTKGNTFKYYSICGPSSSGASSANEIYNEANAKVTTTILIPDETQFIGFQMAETSSENYIYNIVIED